jgi:hypothetical protein
MGPRHFLRVFRVFYLRILRLWIRANVPRVSPAAAFLQRSHRLFRVSILPIYLQKNRAVYLVQYLLIFLRKDHLLRR